MPGQQYRSRQDRVRILSGEVADRSMQAVQSHTAIMVSKVLGVGRFRQLCEVSGGDGQQRVHNEIVSSSYIQKTITQQSDHNLQNGDWTRAYFGNS